MENARRLLLLRFGELWLKSFEVQRRFKDRLLTNIREMFSEKKVPAKIISSRDRIFLETDARNFEAVLRILSHTFGLVSFSNVSKISADKSAIISAAANLAKEILLPENTFAVRVQRSGKHAFTSSELERECGAKVVDVLGNKVNLTKPDRTIYVDVRDGDAYIFSEKLPAPGGLPLGAEGKLVLPFTKEQKHCIVAAYLMMKRGCRILPVFVKGEPSAAKSVAFLEKFDPHVKPYFSGTKNINQFAIALCRKKNAKGIVLAGRLSDFYKSNEAKTFDRKANIPYLYPLVGLTETEIGTICESISG